jgi:hypothetical protein
MRLFPSPSSSLKCSAASTSSIDVTRSAMALVNISVGELQVDRPHWMRDCRYSVSFNLAGEGDAMDVEDMEETARK